MCHCHYPGMDIQTHLPPGWVCKQPAAKTGDAAVHDSCEPDYGDLVAIDCEMVSTRKEGNALARITAIDKNYRVLMDKMVLPPDPIIDYKTQFSGIT